MEVLFYSLGRFEAYLWYRDKWYLCQVFSKLKAFPTYLQKVTEQGAMVYEQVRRDGVILCFKKCLQEGVDLPKPSLQQQ